MPSRILKESICTSEEIDKLNSFCECFFYRLLVNCDDFGRMDGRLSIIKSKLYPLKEIRLEQIEKALQALSSAELVTRYDVNGRPFLQMKTWERHQQIRAKKSRYPAPKNEEHMQLKSSDINCNQMISDENKCHRNPIQSNPIRNRNIAHEDDGELLANAELLNAVFDAAEGIGLKGSASDDKANRLVADYTAEWVLEAITRASSAPQSAWCWRYVEAILRKWKQSGGIDSEAKPEKLQKPIKVVRAPEGWTG